MQAPVNSGFSPARMVEQSILQALGAGERWVTTIRLVAALAVASTWPLTAAFEPAIAARQRAIAMAALAVAAASAAALFWLRRHEPGSRFAALSVSLDLAMVTGILLLIMWWRGPWYGGLPTVVGMPAMCLAIVTAGLRLARLPAAIGIALGWGLTGALLAADVALYDASYPASVANVLGVAVNLFAASFVCAAMSGRTRAWIDEAASLALVAARAAQRLGAYLPRAVAEATLAEEEPLLSARSATTTVMFTRLRDLPASMSGDGARVVDDLNAYFLAITACVQTTGGIIDKYRHDGVMAVFGAPVMQEDAAARALVAAEMMEAALERLNDERRGDGRPPFVHGVGIHHGTVALGTVGTRDRLSYTAVGDAVNVAARVASLAAELGGLTLSSEATVASARREVEASRLPPLRALGERTLRGRRAPVELHVLERRASVLPPSANQRTQASWDAQPSSHLISGAWREASLASARDATRQSESISTTVLDRAAVDAERRVAWMRGGVGAMALLLAPYLSDSESHAPLAFAVAGSFAVLSSAVLWRLLQSGTRRWLLGTLPVALDFLLVAGVLGASLAWHSDRYRGLAHVPAFGLLYVAILASGIRMRRRSVVAAAVLGFVAAGALLAVDHARYRASVLDLTSVTILLCGSVAIAYASTARSIRLVTAVARQARDAVRARARLGAYASEAVAEHALESAELELGGRWLERVAVVACDLRGFTGYAEELDPEELVTQLNDYFEAIAAPVRQQEGVIDGFVGDALLVVFGAPKPYPRPASRAIQAAAGMRRALEAHNRERASRGLPPLVHGIGVHVGPAVAGHIGTPERATFTVVGAVMKEAEALERAAKEQETAAIVSDAALAAARAEGGALPDARPLGRLALAGMPGLLEAHALA